jgi:hypothetical protein
VNVKSVARKLAGKLHSTEAIILLASELLRHVDMNKVTMISNALRNLVSSEDGNMHEARKLIGMARSLMATSSFSKNFNKGYEFGVVASSSLRWCIEDCIKAAIVMADKSGVPELKRLTSSFKRGLGDYKQCADDRVIKRTGEATIRKAKKYGVAGMAGAVAAILEDPNAHKEAGLVYKLLDDLEETYGDVVGTMPVVGNEKVARELIAVARELMGKLPPRYAHLVPDRGKISFSIRLGKDYEAAAVERLGQELSRMVKKDLRGTSFRYRLGDPWIAKGTGGDHLMVVAKGRPYYEQEIAMALDDFIITS